MDNKTLTQLEVIKTRTYEISCAQVQYSEIVLPLLLTKNTKYCGFDPGTKNFGIAIIYGNIGEIYQVKITTSRDPIIRIKDIQEILEAVHPVIANTVVVIEGAAFRGGFRQQELAEMRAAIAIYSLKFTELISFAAPMSVRKLVFGKGTIKPQEVWSGLSNDALAALSCAYYGYKNEFK